MEHEDFGRGFLILPVFHYCLIIAFLVSVRVAEAAPPAPAQVPPPPGGRQTLAMLDFSTALGVEAALMRAQLPATFTVRAASPFVVASDLPPVELDRVIAQTLLPAHQALNVRYIRRAPVVPVRVYLFAGQTSLAVLSRILWKDDTPPVYGYSRKDRNMMVMDISTGGGTLVHELTHVMMWADFPAVPNWFNEGLSSLHEAVKIFPDRLQGLPNWRGGVLREVIRKGRLRTLSELVSDPDFYGKNSDVNYAHARYFCLFLQDRCDLKRFYELMKAASGTASPTTALVRAATVCSVPEARLEMEFQAYLPKLLGP
ncbi:hypothetical protein KKD52_17430 [Myxococcota bacterium]|nr:hypothetical protein [Myxococcota bacterium]MBU1410275.1 hypothetical protein [Myxococcota bacterium]MBU1512138.1 hypothetical protein [Myxococcota bacterium]